MKFIPQENQVQHLTIIGQKHLFCVVWMKSVNKYTTAVVKNVAKTGLLKSSLRSCIGKEMQKRGAELVQRRQEARMLEPARCEIGCHTAPRAPSATAPDP